MGSGTILVTAFFVLLGFGVLLAAGKYYHEHKSEGVDS